MSLLLYAHDRDRIQYVEVASFFRRLATAEAARIGPPLRCVSTRWAAPVLTRRERRGASPSPDLFYRPENGGTNQIMRGNQYQKCNTPELGWYFAIGHVLEHNRSHVL